MGLMDGEGEYEIPPVVLTREELEKFHTAEYLEAILRVQQGKLSNQTLAMGLGTPDCPIFADMFNYLSLASGATVTAAREILNGNTRIAFNPSGGFHHASPAKAAGFCFFNDVVLGILELTNAGKRVLFLDIDVHHGDGVQNAFYRRSDVMTISMHESGATLFPGTGAVEESGEGEGAGYSVNLPLPAGTYDAAYDLAFRQVVMPLINKFDPDVIVIELGMDGLANDPLAHLSLTNNVYADILGTIVALNKPLLATGGGGYNPENTARSWALMWSVMCGADDPYDAGLTVGGMMIQNTEWTGGLRDRSYLSEAGVRKNVDRDLLAMIDLAKKTIFPMHGIG
jgi:acetoin utilization protein AcuC